MVCGRSWMQRRCSCVDYGTVSRKVWFSTAADGNVMSNLVIVSGYCGRLVHELLLAHPTSVGRLPSILAIPKQQVTVTGVARVDL